MEGHWKWTQKDGIYRLYVSRKGERGGHTNTEYCVDISILGPEDYIEKSKERLISAASNSIGNWDWKNKKSVREKFRKPSSAAEISSKG